MPMGMIVRYDMSHSDNTQRKFDTNLPAWHELKLMIRHVEPAILYSRQADNRQWRRDMEMELSA